MSASEALRSFIVKENIFKKEGLKSIVSVSEFL
jgi:hypothetical protein